MTRRLLALLALLAAPACVEPAFADSWKPSPSVVPSLTILAAQGHTAINLPSAGVGGCSISPESYGTQFSCASGVAYFQALGVQSGGLSMNGGAQLVANGAESMGFDGYTANATCGGEPFCTAMTGGLTLTLPAPRTYPAAGVNQSAQQITAVNASTGTLTVSPGTRTINGASGTINVGTGAAARFVATSATNWQEW